MHDVHADLLNKLFTALDEHNHEKMASCYHRDAHFRDIAFNLRGREKIHDMWRMICTGKSNIQVKFEVVDADERTGRVAVIDTYTFGADPSKDPPDDGRPVVNLIDSQFRFKDRLVLHHHDHCDAKEWARQALDDGKPKGRIMSFLAGRVRLARSIPAGKKLRAFVAAEQKPTR